LAKSAFARALPCSPVSRTWASPGQLPGGERSGWEEDHISLVKVEDKLKVKKIDMEGDLSLNEHQQENLDCEQEHNQRRCALETTLVALHLMGAPYESELCFANNVPVFSLHIKTLQKVPVLSQS